MMAVAIQDKDLENHKYRKICNYTYKTNTYVHTTCKQTQRYHNSMYALILTMLKEILIYGRPQKKVNVSSS